MLNLSVVLARYGADVFSGVPGVGAVPGSRVRAWVRKRQLISTKTLLSTRGTCCLDDVREDEYLRSNCSRRLISDY